MPAPCRVLIVESDPSDLFLITRVMSKACPSCALVTLSTAEEVILYLTGEPPYEDRSKFPAPNLMLMDLKMSGMGGFALLEWLQTRPDLDTVAVLVLTGSEMPKDHERALELGADEFHIKPHDYSAMEGLLRAVAAKWLSTPSGPAFG